MLEAVDYLPVTFDKKTLLILKDKDICLSVNTKYYNTCDPLEMSKKIEKAVERYPGNDNNTHDMNTVYLFVTDVCNLNCEFCSMRSDQKENTTKFSISLKLVEENLLPLLQQLNPRKVIISGGEPFLHKEITDIIDLLHRNMDARITVQSNGTLLTEDIAERIKDSVSYMEISTSHYDDLGKLEKSIRLLAEKRIEITLSYVHEDGMETLKRVVDLSAKYNTGFLLNFVAPTGSALDNQLHILGYQDRLKVYECLAEYILLKGYHEKQVSELFFASISPAKPCGAYGKMLAIFPEGDVFMCHSLKHKEFYIGNSSKNTKEEIIYNWKELLESEDIESYFNKDTLDGCKECEFSPVCGGICPGERYNGIESVCMHRKTMFLYNILVFDGRKSITDNLKGFLDFVRKAQNGTMNG